MKIVTLPNPILTQKAKKVGVFDKKLRKIVADMIETLHATVDPVGVGLAAPQVGLPLQLFLMRPTPKSKTEVFINPVISNLVEKKTNPNDERTTSNEQLEGCLSIPLLWGPVKRAHELTLDWVDITGKPQQKVFKGFKATIIQHEVDHLHGILFTKHVLGQGNPLYEERGGKLYELK